MSQQSEAELLRAEFVRDFGVPAATVEIVRSPYRICPLGAHIDHQGGNVTALAIDRAVHLAFAPAAEPECRLRSWTFPGETQFRFDQIAPPIGGDWGNYARGAVAALQSHHSLTRGIVGLTAGSMSEGGLSSSAAVGVAYLLALEHVNGIQATAWENIEFDRLIENDYLGLRNGILDQAAILLSRGGNLTVINCQERTHELVPLPADAAPHAWLIASSGLRQSLISTGYNQRVDECAEAARVLLAAAGRPNEKAVLGSVTAEEYSRFNALLTGAPAKRARHFFTESQRVTAGINAWQHGDLAEFGKLMTASGRSSIEQYECGSPPLVDLYEILTSTPGVLGARFSGAGFRGCSIALVEADRATEAARLVEERYKAAHPEFAADAAVTVCHSEDGAQLL